MRAVPPREQPKLSAEDRKALEVVSHFHALAQVKDLPATILHLCAPADQMANPGEKWEPTDVIMDKDLPNKRLIWAVTDNDYYVVHYESGGIAHLFNVLIARVKKGEAAPKVIWRGSPGVVKDYAEFSKAVER